MSIVRVRAHSPRLPVSRLADVAYDGIMHVIRHGQLQDNGRLTEITLCQALDMSRTPVREAINRLVAEGIFVGVPHSGVTIRHLGDRDLLDLLDVHEALMVQAARRAALTLQQTDLDELNRMIHEMSQVAVCADNLDDAPDRLRHLAAQWVEHLIALAAVDALTRLHHRQLALWEALWPNHWSHLPELQPFLHLPAWHTLFGPVMDALASRDPDLAARAVRTLMNHLRGKFSALFAMRVRLAHMTNG